MRIEIQNGQCENCKLYCKNCGVCLIYDDAENKKELCRKDFSVSELKRIEKKLQHLPAKTQRNIRDNIDDRELKDLFTYRIMFKKKWFEIAEKVYCDRRTASRKFEQFLKGALSKEILKGNSANERY